MTFRIYVDFAMAPDVLELLQEGTVGHQLIFPATPAASALSRPERDPQFSTADIAFGQPDPQAIESAATLKWIQVSTSGITRYDNPRFRELLKQRNILLSNSAHVYNEYCALHVFSFILAQLRNLPVALATRVPSSDPAWHGLRNSYLPPCEQTLLILGYGAIGRRLAELLAPLGMKVIAYRRQPRGDENVAVIGADRLAQALADADHVVNILPDNSETVNFFAAGRFAVIKPGAAFYNIGRGTTVDQDALLTALQSGQLSAAWLDVTDPEPLPEGHPLLLQPNCFITPHVAGGHRDEGKTLVRHFLTNLKRFIQGEELVDRVF